MSWDWPRGEDGEGGGGSLSAVWWNNTDLEPETGASVLRSGHEQKESLLLRVAESSPSSNSIVCLLNLRVAPVSLERQVELRVLKGAGASEKDTWSFSFGAWAVALSCPRRLLSFLVSRFMGLLETLLDCRGAIKQSGEHWVKLKSEKCSVKVKQIVQIKATMFWKLKLTLAPPNGSIRKHSHWHSIPNAVQHQMQI